MVVIMPMLSVVLLFFAFLCKQDKKAFWLLWIFMAITTIMNTYNNADWNAYEFMYGLINTIKRITLTDVGYGILNFFANNYLGLSFFQFRAIFTFVGMLILARIIIKHTCYPPLVLALYFIAPFFPNDIIQIRNFMAQVILSFFLTKWIDSENKKIVWIILGISLSTTVHVSTIYFTVFFLLYFIKDNRKLYIGVGVASLLVGTLPILLSKIPFISSEKIGFYLGNINQGIDVRGLIIIGAFTIQLYILYYIFDFSKKTNNIQLIKWSGTVYRMNILCLPACVIMSVWTFNFYRVPRNMLLLNYIVYAMYLKVKNGKNHLNFLTVILILLGICWSTLNSFSQWSVI